MTGCQLKTRLDSGSIPVWVESLSHDGRGVARLDGKTVFIDDALPGEEVTFNYVRRRRSFDEGRLASIITASPDRVEPGCEHFGVCGGCSLQHLGVDAQIKAKQRVLVEQLERIGHVSPVSLLESLRGPIWGYRRKARLGVRFVTRKGRVLVGFRERRKSYIADLQHCDVLHPAAGLRLTELAALIGSLSVNRQIPQVEVAVGDNAAALVLRHLVELTQEDQNRLSEFSVNTGLQVHLQSGGLDTLVPLSSDIPALSYTLDEYNLVLEFLPTDFIQVNAEINRKMIRQALELLAPEPDHRLLDLFCGIGNFTLPLARTCRSVTGIEGESGLVRRARHNARINAITNAEFHTAPLDTVPEAPWSQVSYDGILFDPPRSGAQELLHSPLPSQTRRIVYVSCNTATLARDAGILVNEHGFRLECVGVMDMFPHTTHVESMALFTAT